MRVFKLIHYLLRDLFAVGFVGLLLLLVIEDIRPGFVSFWMSIKLVLLIVGVIGLLALITSKFDRSFRNLSSDEREEKIKDFDSHLEIL